MSESLKKEEAWKRLVSGESLAGLSLTTKGGRIDLSGLNLRKPQALESWQTALANVTRIEPNGIFRDTVLRDLDLTASKLLSIHFIGCEISNCCFDDCEMEDFRIYATTTRDSTFRRANLKETALGAASIQGPYQRKRNSFIGVDFSQADLRKTSYVAAAFEGCFFRNTKLSNIDFGTTSFKDCIFEGELRQVRFWRSDLFARGYPESAFPPNEMVGIDFSNAKLRDVEFRGLSLDRVRLPDDAAHIMINDFPGVLDKLISVFRQQGDETARSLVAFLGVYRKWTVPNARGVLNKQDLADIAPDAVERVVGLLQQFAAKVQ